VHGDKRIGFESAVAYLLPVYPVVIKMAKRGKMENASVRVIAGGGFSGGGAKAGIGKSSVSLCYHKYSEFEKLNEEQKKELKSWKATNKGKKCKGGSPLEKGNKKFKSTVSAMNAETKEMMQAMADSHMASIAALWTW
jgi:hypothetical protein